MTTPTEPPDKPKPRLRIAKPGDDPPSNGRMTRADRAAILDIVAERVIDGHRVRQIREMLRAAHENGIAIRPGDPNSPRRYLPRVSNQMLDQLIARVHAELEEDGRASREERVRKMSARLMGIVRDAKRNRNFHAAIRAEEQLARIHGLYAPTHFTVGFDQREAVLKVLDGMDDDAIRKLADEADETRRKSELYDNSIEALGVSVSPQAGAQVPQLPGGPESGTRVG